MMGCIYRSLCQIYHLFHVIVYSMLSICSSLLMIKMINMFLISICTGHAVASHGTRFVTSVICAKKCLHDCLVAAAIVVLRCLTTLIGWLLNYKKQK